MVGKHAVAGMASEAGGDWVGGDVRGWCQAAAHLGLSRKLIWHRLKLLPTIGGSSLRMPPTNPLAQFPADGEIKGHPTSSAIAGKKTTLNPRLTRVATQATDFEFERNRFVLFKKLRQAGPCLLF